MATEEDGYSLVVLDVQCIFNVRGIVGIVFDRAFPLVVGISGEVVHCKEK